MLAFDPKAMNKTSGLLWIWNPFYSLTLAPNWRSAHNGNWILGIFLLQQLHRHLFQGKMFKMVQWVVSLEHHNVIRLSHLLLECNPGRCLLIHCCILSASNSFWHIVDAQ